ncbi:predicted protein [Nematostella vectensis]|uniref:Uncharacterized protein n=1 Tax=Nematostella vectensis TaxID=45351 RepID=A7T5W4_NEMVE|nr:predicted protein [Nematostella vectensis]|eukprot:XP_001620747.1 hypothetical protein NEMVEDRAFT_v1g222754 [Nematostella vectensis]
MRKLRDLQAQLEERGSELSRRESKILMLEAEKDTAIKRMRDSEGRINVQDDCTALIKENAALAAQVVELQKHIDMDRAHRDEKDVRRHANIQELISTKENEKQLKIELEKTRELLRLEQSALRDALDKVSRSGMFDRAKMRCSLFAENTSKMFLRRINYFG